MDKPVSHFYFLTTSFQKSEKAVNQAADIGDISNGMTDEAVEKLM